MEFNCRDAKKEDVSDMVDLGTNVDEFEVSQDEVVFWDKASLEKWVRSEKDLCFVAEMDGDIIGFILSHIHNPTGKVEIENVYIKEEFRREGVAERLHNEILSKYESMSADFAVSLVKTKNHEMHGFNKDMGFNKGGKIVWWEYNF